MSERGFYLVPPQFLKSEYEATPTAFDKAEELVSYDRAQAEEGSRSCFLSGCPRKFRLAIFVVFAVAIITLPMMLPYPSYNANRTGNLREPVSEIIRTGWENKSRDIYSYVKVDNDTRILKPTQSGCHKHSKLLIIVCSAVNNSLQRSAIRATWASNLPRDECNVVFLVGTTDNTTVQEELEQESEQNGDIIQESFVDTYFNLTLKSVFMLKQVVDYCPHVEFVLKSDDDMFIQVPNLLRLINNIRVFEFYDILLGHLICDAKPITDVTSKWYNPPSMFEGKVYPRYLSGTSYLMDRALVRRLYEAAFKIQLFHLEDIFITGFCSQAIYVTPRNYYGFSYITRPLDPCLYLTSRHLISSHRISPKNMEELWARIHAQNVSECTKSSSKEHNLSRLATLPRIGCGKNRN